MCTILFLKVNSIISYHHQGYNSHGSFIHLLLWPLSKHNHGISYPDFACAKPHPSKDTISTDNSRPFNAEPQLQRTNKDFWLSLQNYNSKPSTVLPFIKFHPIYDSISKPSELHHLKPTRNPFLAHLLSIVLILMELCFTDPSIWLSDPWQQWSLDLSSFVN